jgi:gamma-glutamyl hydrolase
MNNTLSIENKKLKKQVETVDNININKKTIKKNIGDSNNKTHKYKPNMIIGMLTVPLSPDGKYHDSCGNSYIVTAHLDWLKSQGIRIIPVPYYKANLEPYLKKVSGVYLPSGGAFAQTQPEYYFAAKKLIQYAIKENDKGNYFPVWGACMGMQQMLIALDGNDNYETFLESFDSHKNLYLPLHFTDEGKNSRIFSLYTPRELKDMEQRRCSLHNHKMGISPEKFNKSKGLREFFNVINISYDRNGKAFVSTIEAKNYPIYGVQWHPERKKNYYKLSVFFKNELKKNNKIRHNLNSTKLKTRKIKCMKYSNNLYKYCNFYWEKETDVNNPNQCDIVANSKKNKNKKIYDVIG